MPPSRRCPKICGRQKEQLNPFMRSRGTIVIAGFGNIGQAVVPLLRQTLPDWRIVAIDQHDAGRRALAEAMNVAFIERRLEASNVEAVLGPLLGEGDVLLNLACAVSTCALIRVAQQVRALYLDTGIEPWQYEISADSPTSNHALREQVLALKRASGNTSTALVAHGANPGFVSILVKMALLDMARTLLPKGGQARVPACRAGWASLAAELDVRVIQISERDTQRSAEPRAADEFVNTWSVDGFEAECLQPAELGWGTHEPSLPRGASAYRDGCGAAIELATSGHQTIVRTWTPMHGEFPACVLTHNESISIADYLTLGDARQPLYRPTVYYAYRPADVAIESLALLNRPYRARVMKDDIADGIDELGVFVMSGRGTSLWLGSALSIAHARSRAPLNNATSLQVASSIVGGIEWMLAHPFAGIVESDEVEHAALFERVRPWWEPMQRRYTSWRPASAHDDLAFASFHLPEYRSLNDLCNV
jgi:homospermidine synthase